MKTLKVIVNYSQNPSIIDQTMYGMKLIKARVDVEIECVAKSSRFTRYTNISLSSQSRLTKLFNDHPDWIEYKDGKLIFRIRRV